MGFRIKFGFWISLGVSVTILALPLISRAQTVTFASNQAMVFGLLEFGSPHSGSLTIGTNGSASLTGSGLFYEGGAIPGQISIMGNTGIVEVKCESTATLGGSTTLQITNIEVRANSGGPINSGTSCQGVGGADPIAVNLDLGATPDVRLYFGGKLNIPTNALNTPGNYSTTSGGGNPLSLSAVFQ